MGTSTKNRILRKVAPLFEFAFITALILAFACYLLILGQVVYAIILIASAICTTWLDVRVYKDLLQEIEDADSTILHLQSEVERLEREVSTMRCHCNHR